MIVAAMLEGHRKMIKQLRGVPGVTDAKMYEGKRSYLNTLVHIFRPRV